MQSHIITKATTPEEKQQAALHQSLRAFMGFMKSPKDAGEIRKDTLQPVPVGVLPMVF